MSTYGAVRAIETVYNGYRFRSRLEARWAVFFDALGVKYQYEPEGFDLDGTLYLPDFWLPDQECWFEVKGQEPSYDERAKIGRLASIGSPVMVAIGGDFRLRWVPNQGPPLPIYQIDPINGCLTDWIIPSYCTKHRRLIFYNIDGHLNGKPTWDGQRHIKLMADCCAYASYDSPGNQAVESAYLAARQARFEHGESGGRRFQSGSEPPRLFKSSYYDQVVTSTRAYFKAHAEADDQ